MFEQYTEIIFIYPKLLKIYMLKILQIYLPLKLTVVSVESMGKLEILEIK